VLRLKRRNGGDDKKNKSYFPERTFRKPWNETRKWDGTNPKGTEHGIGIIMDE
jgi:hypothetical protein